jgi:hypothetical protein
MQCNIRQQGRKEKGNARSSVMQNAHGYWNINGTSPALQDLCGKLRHALDNQVQIRNASFLVRRKIAGLGPALVAQAKSSLSLKDLLPTLR